VVSPQGPALRLLDLILSSHVLVLSRFILDEVEHVLLYPRLQVRYRLTASEVARFTEKLAEVLCTRNIRHFDVPEVHSFCAAQSIRVLTDLEVLGELLE
jgi:predicted nucleic acid-binding protein